MNVPFHNSTRSDTKSYCSVALDRDRIKREAPTRRGGNDSMAVTVQFEPLTIKRFEPRREFEHGSIRRGRKQRQTHFVEEVG